MEQAPTNKPQNIFYTQESQIGCDGGDAFGHPLVFLEVEDNGGALCPYCSRKFIYKEA